MDYPGPKGIQEILEDVFKGYVRSPRVESGGLTASAADLVGALREAVGPRAWPALRSSLSAMLLLRDHPVLLTMPRAVIIR